MEFFAKLIFGGGEMEGKGEVDIQVFQKFDSIFWKFSKSKSLTISSDFFIFVSRSKLFGWTPT